MPTALRPLACLLVALLALATPIDKPDGVARPRPSPAATTASMPVESPPQPPSISRIAFPPPSVFAQEPAPGPSLHLPWLARGAARGAELDLRGQWGGPARAVVLDGDYAWLGVGARVLAIELASEGEGGGEPRLLGAVTLPGVVRDLVLDGPRRRLHVALWASPSDDGPRRPGAPAQGIGLLITLDVLDPSQPREAIRHPLESASALALEDDLLVVAADRERPAGSPEPTWAGLIAFAIDADGLPRLRARHPLSDAHGLALVAGFAYSCDPLAGALAAVDLRDPSAPRDAGLLLASPCHALASGAPGELYALEPGGDVGAEDVGRPPVLVRLGLADPARPERGATLPLVGAAWGDSEDSPLASHATSFAVGPDEAWVAGWHGAPAWRPWLRRVDLRDPAAPSPAPSTARTLPNDAPALDLALADGRVALAEMVVGDGPEGLALSALTEAAPFAPELLQAGGALSLLEAAGGEGHVDGDVGNGGDGGVSEGGNARDDRDDRDEADQDGPGAWTRSAFDALPGGRIVEAAVDASSQRAYLLEAGAVGPGDASQLHLWVDLGAAPPRVLRRIALSAGGDPVPITERDRWQRDMVAGGGVVVLTVAGDTQVVDLRAAEGRSEPRVTRAATGATALALVGDTLYTGGGGSLIAWRIDDGGRLQPLGPALDLPDHPWLRLAATTGHLWLTTAPRELAHFDTTDPSAPVERGRVALEGEGALLAAFASRAVALDGSGSLVLLEAGGAEAGTGGEEATAPTVLARHALRGRVAPTAALSFDGQRAWWPTLAGGLAGLDLSLPGAPAELVIAARPAWVPAPDPGQVPAGDGEDAPADEGVNPWQSGRVASWGGENVLVTRFGGGATLYRLHHAVAP